MTSGWCPAGRFLIFLLICSTASHVAVAQTGTAAVSGVVLDKSTQKPVASAFVTAVRSGLPAFYKMARAGVDGSFSVKELLPGQYSLCVQVLGDGYVDPCMWNGTPTALTLGAAQVVTGTTLQVAPASMLRVVVQDAGKNLAKKTRDGRAPGLLVGVWRPNGTFCEARVPVGSTDATKSSNEIVYQLGVPRDLPLKVHVFSRDLRLADDQGADLAGNASTQAFQHTTGDKNPKTFVFKVLGLAP